MFDKKELKERYKQIKPEMGVFMYRVLTTGKAYLGFGQNVKADINSITFQLKLGSYPTNSNLQKDWQDYGENNFEIAVIEKLAYDKDEAKTDYTSDLRLLRDFCSERFKVFEYIFK